MEIMSGVCVGGVYFLTFQLQGLAQVMQEAAGGRNVKIWGQEIGSSIFMRF